jgi:hypothetical protein
MKIATGKSRPSSGAKPIFQDEFISKQTRWQMHAFWTTAALLAGAIGVIAYLVVTKPIRMGILVTDQHGNPTGAIQPISATGDVPAVLVNAFICDFIGKAFTITADWSYDDYLYGMLLGVPGRAGWAQGDANVSLRNFYLSAAHDPRKLYTRQSQQAKVTSIIKLPAGDWYEVTCTVYALARNDDKVTSTDWKAVLRIKWADVTDTDPYGLYADNLQMQEEFK